MHRPAVFLNRYSLFLAGLVVFSAVVRGLLIFSGFKLVQTDGQEYFDFSRQFYQYLLQTDFQSAFSLPVLGHWGSIVLGAIPFALPLPGLSAEENSAVFFALPSLVNIVLIYSIACGFNWHPRTACLSALLYALTVSNLYQTRFVLLMDLSMMFFLLAFRTVQFAGSACPLRRFLAGLLCFATFFTYYGYWMIAGWGLVYASLSGAQSLRQIVRFGLLAAIGFLLPMTAFFLLLHSFDVDWWQRLQWFSSTAIQGDFVDGFLIPFEFLFLAEGALFLVFLICIFFMVKRGLATLLLWLWFPLIFIYALFVIGSNLLEYYVVLGRHVRQLTPFLCLLSAFVLVNLGEKKLAFVLAMVVSWFFYQYLHIYQSRFNLDETLTLERLRQMPAYQGVEIQRIDSCLPARAECPQVPAECHVIDRFVWGMSYPVYQYDAMNRTARQNIRGTKLYSVFFVCP